MTYIEHGQTRAAVVAEAMTWLGTPYHHHARIKGVGVDCAQILIAVYAGLGLAPEIDPGHYAPDWHLHHSEELYEQWLKTAGGWIVDEPLPGDVGLFKFGRTFSHGAIYIGEDLWVHSYLQRGVIQSRGSEDPLHSRSVRYWRVIGAPATDAAEA